MRNAHDEVEVVALLEASRPYDPHVVGREEADVDAKREVEVVVVLFAFSVFRLRTPSGRLPFALVVVRSSPPSLPDRPFSPTRGQGRRVPSPLLLRPPRGYGRGVSLLGLLGLLVRPVLQPRELRAETSTAACSAKKTRTSRVASPWRAPCARRQESTLPFARRARWRA